MIFKRKKATKATPKPVAKPKKVKKVIIEEVVEEEVIVEDKRDALTQTNVR